MKVSDNFNATLLNRIGHERFKETRTAAFLPKRAPLVTWRSLVPALASATLLLLAVVYWPALEQAPAGVQYAHSAQGDDWLTVQPSENPNMTASLDKDWSLRKQLSSADRMSRLSNGMTDRSGFGNMHLASGMDRRSAGMRGTPVIIQFYRMQPVITIYQRSQPKSVSEDEEIF